MLLATSDLCSLISLCLYLYDLRRASNDLLDSIDSTEADTLDLTATSNSHVDPLVHSDLQVSAMALESYIIGFQRANERCVHWKFSSGRSANGMADFNQLCPGCMIRPQHLLQCDFIEPYTGASLRRYLSCTCHDNRSANAGATPRR